MNIRRLFGIAALVTIAVIPIVSVAAELDEPITNAGGPQPGASRPPPSPVYTPPPDQTQAAPAPTPTSVQSEPSVTPIPDSSVQSAPENTAIETAPAPRVSQKSVAQKSAASTNIPTSDLFIIFGVALMSLSTFAVVVRVVALGIRALFKQ